MAPPSDLPSWVQEITIIAVACLSVVVAVYRYMKTEGSKSSGKALEHGGGHVVAASFVDSKLLKELIDALREHEEESARVALRLTRSNSELREAILENTEITKLQTDATLNMLRFIRQNKGD